MPGEKKRENRTKIAENARFRKKAVTRTRNFQDRLVMTASITLLIMAIISYHILRQMSRLFPSQIQDTS